MDNITNTQIAKLVLGYLKSENNQTTVNEFIKSSPYFKTDNPKKNKYIVTRVLGQSLTEILHQYAKIYTIIQERLEETEFFNKQTFSVNLVNQLIYLLDNNSSSTCSSPASVFEDSYYSTPRKQTVDHDLTYAGTTSPSINATPLKNLPGNTSSHYTPQRIVQLPSTRSHRTNRSCVQDNEELESERSNHENDDCLDNVINVFAQTLLDHEELHEKLANNINTVRHSELASTSQETKPSKDNHLNNTCTTDDIDSAIKAVLDKTESDPLFETLIGDIIGSINENKLKNDGLEDKSKAEKRASLNKLIENIENVNKEGIEEGVNTSQNIQQTTEPTTFNSNQNDIIMYDGSLDTFMKNSNGTVASIQPSNVPPVLYNPNGLLMVQPQPNTNFIPNPDPTKSFIFINVPQPQTQYILTEQDILTMPTIIVQDGKQKKTKPLEKSEPRKTRNSEKKIKTLLPKSVGNQQSLTDYIKLYKCGDPLDENVTEYKKQSPKKQNSTKLMPKIHVEIIEPEIVSSVSESEEKAIPKKAAESDKGPKSLTSILTPENNRKSKRSQSTPRSTNRSHVRALDFKFTTPGKQEIAVKTVNASPNAKKNSTEKKNPSKTVKTLFSSPVFMKKSPGSWDSELRMAACSGPMSTRPPSPRKKKRKIQNRAKLDNMNKTAEDAHTIEAALTLDSSQQTSSGENKGKRNNSKKSAEKSTKAKRRSRVKKPAQLARNSTQPEEIKETHDPMEIDNECNSSKIVEDKPEHNLEITEITLINCNSQPRYKRKCNIDKNVRKINETTDKLILSPSKIHNASKRSILNTDSIVSQQTEIVKVNIIENKMELIPSTSDEQCCIITPETIKQVTHLPPSTAKRNIIPILETPVKFDPAQHPKTPGFFSPVNTNDTPFTKVFKEHLQGVDISNIETPKFPLTPNFPFTPLMDHFQSPANNRPTDYSTSSSYYQPSDTEQNKSLELMIKEECVKRMEINKVPPVEIQSHAQVVVVPDKHIETQEEEIVPKDVPSQADNTEDTCNAIVAQMKSLKNNVIGRKNLNLLKPKTSDEDSSSSGTDSDSDSNSASSNSSWADNAPNDTVVNNYPLRSKQNSSAKKDSNELAKSKENKRKSSEIQKEAKFVLQNIKNIISNTEFVPQLTSKDNIDVELSKQDKVLRELEEKKKRTIARIKGKDMSPIGQSDAVKNKTDLNAEKQAVDAKSAKKVIPKKQPPKTPSRAPVRRNLRSNTLKRNTISPQPEKPVELHISSDDESLEPMRMVEVQLQSSNSNTPIPDGSIHHPVTSFEDVLKKIENKSKVQDPLSESIAPSSDQEAEKLVKGLKKWGIHLVHNKSPKCQKGTNPYKVTLEKLKKKTDLSILLVDKINKNKGSSSNENVLEKAKMQHSNEKKKEAIDSTNKIKNSVEENKKILEDIVENNKDNIDERKPLIKAISESVIDIVANDLEMSLEDGEVLTDEEKNDNVKGKECLVLSKALPKQVATFQINKAKSFDMESNFIDENNLTLTKSLQENSNLSKLNKDLPKHVSTYEVHKPKTIDMAGDVIEKSNQSLVKSSHENSNLSNMKKTLPKQVPACQINKAKTIDKTIQSLTKSLQETSNLSKSQERRSKEMSKNAKERQKTSNNPSNQERNKSKNQDTSNDKIKTCGSNKILKNEKNQFKNKLNVNISKTRENTPTAIEKHVPLKVVKVDDNLIKSGEKNGDSKKVTSSCFPSDKVVSQEPENLNSTLHSTQEPENLNSSLPVFDITNTKLEEIIHLKHDKKYKSKTVYDLEVMNKKFEVQVFIDELNIDENRTLTITSFGSVLDIPESVNVLIPKKKKISLNEYLKAKPINVRKNIPTLPALPLMTDLATTQSINPETSPLSAAPNKNISSQSVSNEATSHTTKLSKTMKTITDIQSTAMGQSSIQERTIQRDLLTNKTCEKTEEYDATETEMAVINLTKKYNIVQDEKKIYEKLATTDVAGPVKIKSPRSVQLMKSPAPRVMDEELMNFAICCKDNSHPIGNDRRKRTASESEISSNVKRLKPDCQQLLKGVDVDDFLKKLHGDV